MKHRDSPSLTRFNELLALRLDTDAADIFLYWKGRVGLYALLRALGIGPGDEVIIPGYTCVVVANAVLYLGAKPVYCDVDSYSFCCSAEAVEQCIGPLTKLVICQNTYGLSYQVDEIARLARSRNIYSLEDCTHGFGGSYKGRPNGSYCDAAFYSTQWNKPFSTGIGGFVLVNSPDLASKIRSTNADLVRPRLKDILNLKMLYIARDSLITDKTYWTMIGLYRFLSKAGIVVGSSSRDEVSSKRMPLNYFMRMSVTQARKGIKALKRFDAVQRLRKRNATLYTSFLAMKGKNAVPEAFFPDHSFCKYPLLVTDKELFFQRAEASRISIGEWFSSPLHPVQGDLSEWGMESGDCPTARYLAGHVVNLPTEKESIKETIRFLETNLELIVDAK